MGSSVPRMLEHIWVMTCIRVWVLYCTVYLQYVCLNLYTDSQFPYFFLFTFWIAVTPALFCGACLAGGTGYSDTAPANDRVVYLRAPPRASAGYLSPDTLFYRIPSTYRRRL